MSHIENALTVRQAVQKATLRLAQAKRLLLNVYPMLRGTAKTVAVLKAA